MVLPVDPKCTALKNAMDKQGVTFAQLADKIGDSEERLTQVLTGATQPTEGEFNKIADALKITDVPHSGKHATV